MTATLNFFSSATTSSTTSPDAAHLLWSAHIWDKFLYTTAVLLLVPYGLAWMTGSQPNGWWFWGVPSTTTTECHTTTSRPRRAVGWLWHNALLPLAASACCLLQLLLNALAYGCAGWNKVLGPLRPYFMACLLVTGLQQPPKSWQSSLAWTARTSVALLPEALDWYNQYHYPHPRPVARAPQPHESMERRTDATTTTTTTSSEPPPESNVLHVTQVSMDIPGMGCMGCVHAINDALRNVPGVVTAQSHLYPLGFQQGGHATVHYTPRSASDTELLQAVAQAGFSDATITKSVPTTMALPN